MNALVLGLLLFLGVHSTGMLAPSWRMRMVERLGEGRWKALYSLVSLAGFALLVWGFALARREGPPLLWVPPVGLRHLTALLMLPAFIFAAAAYMPGNIIRARLHHPLVLGVKTWAFAHLLANGSVADVLLFGGFLVWAVFQFRALRRRDGASGRVYAPGHWPQTVAAVAVGLVLWWAFAFWLHGWLFGVQPLAR